ncbi:MAG: hypothetical protein HZA62_03590, partial [Rhodocyclales bacterium]|nr:hypothetical protein [Rhodocyclales bacterium]
MTVYTYSTQIFNGQSYTLGAGDSILFDAGVSAFNLNFEPSGSDILFTIKNDSGVTLKSFTLLGLFPYQLSSSVLTFQNGSVFRIGDDTTGAGNDDTATGTLSGTSGNDMLITAGGAQLVEGGLGNDSLATVGANGGQNPGGGTGADTLDGGGGTDWLSLAGVWGAEKYTLTLNGGTDATLAILGTGDVPVTNASAVVRNIENVEGSDVIDVITGDDNANRLAGNAGNDTLSGGLGNDTLVGGQGADNLSGGGGTDTIDYSGDQNPDGNGLGVVVNLSGAAQTNSWGGVSFGPVAIGTALDGWGTTDTFGNRDEIENIQGSSYNDFLIGNGFANYIYGGDGSDLLVGLNGNDTLDGGTAGPSAYFDWVSYSSAAQNGTTGVTGVTVNLGLTTASGKPSPGTGSIDTDTLLNIDGVIASAFNDSLTGGSNSQWFNGDKYEWFQGNAGNDTIDGGRANNAVAMDATSLEYNWARYFGVGSQVIVDLANNTATSDGQGGVDTFVGINAVWGGSAGDSLTGGNALFDYIEVFNGSGGNDTISGGSGKDVAAYRDATVGVTVVLDTDNNAGNGYSGTASDGLGGSDILFDIEAVAGSDFDDTITGGGGDDLFQGRKGADSLTGGAGNDTADYHGDENANSDQLGVVVNLGGATGSATWQGVAYNVAGSTAQDGWGNTDTLTSIENIRGSIYNDVLIGDGNANTITGGQGSDKIDGGAGTDIAAYSGAKVQYTVTDLGGGVWTVLGDNGATDTLSNIETLQFSDQSQSLVGGGPASYNFDSMTDGQAVSFDPSSDTFTSPTYGIQSFDIGPIESGGNAGRGLE